jgi:hypothetical protein
MQKYQKEMLKQFRTKDGRWPRFSSIRLGQREDVLQQKADLLAHWHEVAEDGKIAVIREGMDCDCTQYRRVSVIPMPGLMAWLVEEDKHQQYLDGPESHYFGKPSRHEPGYKSRDRALEAYEDGHPHYVTWGDLDDPLGDWHGRNE